MSIDVKVPAEVIAFCEFEALNQIAAWSDDRFSPEQLVEELRELGDVVPADVNHENVVVFSGLRKATGRQLANQFDEYFTAFLNVAKLAIVRTQVEVKNA